tara:strand:+ start:191 stop:826 length:636 start_codon:yes stop_codon:yes gene_type:complete
MPKTYSLLKVEDGESTYKPQLDDDVDVHKKQVLEKLVVKNTSTSENNILMITKADTSAAGPHMTFDRDSTSPAKGDQIGKIQWKGRNADGDQIRYASIHSIIKDATADSDDSNLTFTIRVGGQHKSMLVVQNDGVLVHVDKPLMLQTTGYKKTRLYGTAATARRDIVFPDQSGTVMVNESGKVMAKDLPTSDPSNEGQLWNDSGTIKISAG